MRRQPTKVQTGRKKRIGIFLASIAITIIVIIGAIYFLYGSHTKRFVIPPFDENAVNGVPTPEDNFGYSEVQAPGNFNFILDSVLWQQEDGSLYVHFTNPSESKMWMLMEIVDTETNTLYKSGVIKSGEYIERINPLTKITNETQNIKIYIYGFEPGTYYSMGMVTLSTVLHAY